MEGTQGIINTVKWYSISLEEVFSKLVSNEKGLTLAQVKERRKKYGKNQLPRQKPTTLLNIILHQLINPLIFILVFAAFASILIGEDKDAVFIGVVIFLNTLIGAYQEYNAERSALGLQKLLRVRTKVLRDGKVKELESELLVPGDIILLESGMLVPADARLFSVSSLEVDESFLTGESVAVIKNLDDLDESTVLGDRKNMVFAGSTVLAGRAQGIVVATGMNTEVGHISMHVSESESAKPPLILRMEKFTKQIAFFIIGLSVILAFFLRMQGMDAGAIFFFVVALAVSAIPEGLPVSLTVALSVAARKMAKRNVIVRRLTSVESLGSCTVIASDKTGTLTVNQQTAKKVILAGKEELDISGEGYNGDGNLSFAHSSPVKYGDVQSLDRLAEIALLANEGGLQKKDDWEHFGDSIDVALLAMGYKYGINAKDQLKDIIEDSLIPYESELKYSGALYRRKGEYYLGVKGAVETILSYCNHQYDEANGSSPLNQDQWLSEADALAAKGYRILAFAEKKVEGPIDRNLLNIVEEGNFIFFGLVCFIDPLRPEAASSVKKCKQAGIQVLMITGDHPATASNIAQELGIIGADGQVVTGLMLKEIGDPKSTQFRELVLSSKVFARVSPAQKLEIVDVLIENGEFVAVTGDGVNDAPALKRANIGVAMGSGTDVAKEVGSMIVVDDDFSSIVAGIEEGRVAYDNVRKVIYLLVSTGAAEVVMFLLAMLFSLPLPLLAVQLLWLNLVTNGIQDKALAFEAAEPGIMRKKPRNPKEGIFNKMMKSQIIYSGLAMGILAFSMWYYLIHYTDLSESEGRNVVLLLMVCLQNLHIFNCRSETSSIFSIPLSSNYFLILLVILAQSLHISCMYIPIMQDVLHIYPINPITWLRVLSLALGIIAAVELFKWALRSKLLKIQLE